MAYQLQSMKEKVIPGENIFSLRDEHTLIDKRAILNEFRRNADRYSFTHFINQRWENIYLELGLLPSVKPLLNFAIDSALKIYRDSLLPHQTLMIPHELLGYEKNEFWFNVANPGESTGEHNHNGKAFLSGVYYLQVPPGSGDLHFKLKDEKPSSIIADTGKLILFPAELDHYVPENQSKEERISLAFNLYILPLIAGMQD